MHSRILLVIYISCLWSFVGGHTNDSDWISTPGHVYACVSQDVTFRWRLVSHEPIANLFWIRSSTGKTALAYYYADGHHQEYDNYVGRTQVTVANQDVIEIVLRGVSKADAGEYLLEVGGPGLRNVVTLHVHRASELAPSITIDNRPYPQDPPFNFTLGDDIIIAVTTEDLLRSNITIQTKDDRVIHTCNNQNICTCALTDQKEVEVLVDYGFCEPPPSPVQINWYQRHMYKTVSPGESDEGATGAWLEETTIEGVKPEGAPPAVAIIVTVLVLLVLALVVVRIVFILLRRKPEEKRTTRDKKYLEFVGGIPRHLTCGKGGQISQDRVEGDGTEGEATKTPMLPWAGNRESEAIPEQENVKKYGVEDKTLPVRAANDSLPQVGGDVADEETTQTFLLPEGTEALPKQENVQKYGVEDETLPVGAVNDSRPEVTDVDMDSLLDGMKGIALEDVLLLQSDEETNNMLPQKQETMQQYRQTKQIPDEEEAQDPILDDDDDDLISPGKNPSSKVLFTLKPAAFNPKHSTSKVDENKRESGIAEREAGSDSLRDTCDVPFTELDVCVGDAGATAKEGVQPKQVGS